MDIANNCDVEVEDKPVITKIFLFYTKKDIKRRNWREE